MSVQLELSLQSLRYSEIMSTWQVDWSQIDVLLNEPESSYWLHVKRSED